MVHKIQLAADVANSIQQFSLFPCNMTPSDFYIFDSVNEILRGKYYGGDEEDELDSLVPSALTFTTGTRHDTYISMNDLYSIHILLVRS